MNFQDTVQRAIEIYKAAEKKKSLGLAALEAVQEGGDVWNYLAVQQAARKIIFDIK